MKFWSFLLLCSFSAFCQPAPQRSEELCATLRQTAAEKGLEFRGDVPQPGACGIILDVGYDLFVTYAEQYLVLALRVNTSVLENADAFWLRLSALDNLAHPALGTKQRSVFDGLNALAKPVAVRQVKDGEREETVVGKTDKAILSVAVKPPQLLFSVSATVRDIDKMKRSAERRASGEIATWRKILSMSLLAFGNAAQSYGNAYRPPAQPFSVYTAPRTCYTNLIGETAFTNCY